MPWWPKPEERAAGTNWKSVCSIVGCPRFVYRNRLCSEHWEPQPETTCPHAPKAFIICGCCGRVCCEACYGAWNVLACGRCRGI